MSDLTNIDREHLTSTEQSLPTIMTPIRKLQGSIKDNYLMYSGTGSDVDDFNPSIMASSVASLIGGFLNQAQMLQDGFYHMNRYTKYSSIVRKTAENINKNASVQAPVYNVSGIPETSQDMWVKPYVTFENVNLNGGIGVSNILYGTLYGGDSGLKDLGNGYKGVMSVFIGYNGAHSSYKDVSMNQEGGALGVTGTLYKGNFFTGITASAGGSAVQAHNMYGTDNFSMITAGIANKTGYNFEFTNGHFIIQPSLLLGYTFAKTFDYTNAAGVKMHSDPLNVIQIIPGVKFIGNTKNGWQPYAGVDMIWNIMGRTSVVAYGVGLQKTWKDNYSAFGQVMLRNGGRTGVVLNAGFNWKIGKDSKKSSDNTKTKKTVIKQVDSAKNQGIVPVTTKQIVSPAKAEQKTNDLKKQEAPIILTPQRQNIELQNNQINKTDIKTIKTQPAVQKTTVNNNVEVNNQTFKSKVRTFYEKMDGVDNKYIIEYTLSGKQRTVLKSNNK